VAPLLKGQASEEWSDSTRVAVNLAAAVILFAVAVGGGAMPRWLVTRAGSSSGASEERSLSFSLGNMLSAGVMVSAGFVHLLGDAIEDMGETDFPVAPLLCATGLLMTIVADAMASSVSWDGGHGDARKTHSAACCDAEGYLQAIDGGGGHSGASEGAGGRAARVSFLTATLLGCALAFHSFLEGAALGAQETADRTLDIFVAIAAHKGLAAYALGSSLVESRATVSRMWSVLLFFAVATPVGIVSGLLLAEFAAGTAAAGCSALASGTFLYVALMEVIPNELSHKDNMAAKISTMILGFSLMSILAKWA